LVRYNASTTRGPDPIVGAPRDRLQAAIHRWSIANVELCGKRGMCDAVHMRLRDNLRLCVPKARFGPFPQSSFLRHHSPVITERCNMTFLKSPAAVARHPMTHKPLIYAAIAAAIVAAAAILAPTPALAEQTTATGAGALNTTARLNFQVVIPRFVRLRVGAPAAGISCLNFAPAAANVGDASVIAATNVAGCTGDIAVGQVTALVQGNAGNVTLTFNAPATGLVSGANNIALTQIGVASVTIPHPATLANGAGNAVTVLAAGANGVVNTNGSWTYTYLNATVPAAGTYTAQVTYVAATP
jgi:hypothetical protein